MVILESTLVPTTKPIRTKVTAQFNPEFDTGSSDSDLTSASAESPNSPESYQRDLVEKLWTGLSLGAKQAFGVELPPYSLSSIKFKTFLARMYGNQMSYQKQGETNLLSGTISLEINEKKPEALLYQLAHEALHILSERIALLKNIPNSNEQHLTLLRSGLEIFRNVFIPDQPVLKTSDGTKQLILPTGVGLTGVNEAITETLAAKLLESSKTFLPDFADYTFEPSAYPEQRRFFNALIRNIVIAWNNPQFRNLSTGLESNIKTQTAPNSDLWEKRYLTLKSSLQLSDTITISDVMTIFENCYLGKTPLSLLARLINTTLGNRTFATLYEESSSASHPESNKVWELISQPEVTAAFQKKDVTSMCGNTKIEIHSGQIPDTIPFGDYEQSSGKIYGVNSTLRKYADLFQHPISLAYGKIIVEAVIKNQAEPPQKTVSPSDALHVVPLPYSKSSTQDSINNFCFLAYCKAAGINLESGEELPQQDGITFFQYTIPNETNKVLLKVSTQPVDWLGDAATFYFVVNK